MNGAWVNREPVDTAVPSAGDEVRIGTFQPVFLDAVRPIGDAG